MRQQAGTSSAISRNLVSTPYRLKAHHQTTFMEGGRSQHYISTEHNSQSTYPDLLTLGPLLQPFPTAEPKQGCFLAREYILCPSCIKSDCNAHPEVQPDWTV